MQASKLAGSEPAAGAVPRKGRQIGHYIDRYLFPKLLQF